MNYDEELRKYFTAAWNEYLRKNPGANQNSWYASNAVNLKKYFDALFQQKQAQAQAPKPAATPQPAPQQPAPAPTQAQQQQPTSQELIAINQAIEAIMAHQGVDRATAEKIFTGQIPRPSDSAYVPQAPTGMPQLSVDPGLQWKQYDELVRSNKEAEALARNRLAYEKGVSLGKVDGTNTLESVDYANQVLATPQNAALAEQIRKGFALGDLPGQTVASYLTRSVDKPTVMPGHMGGGYVKSVLGFKEGTPTPSPSGPAPQPHPIPPRSIKGPTFSGSSGDADPYAQFGGKALVDAMQAYVANGGTPEGFINNVRNAAFIRESVLNRSIQAPNQYLQQATGMYTPAGGTSTGFDIFDRGGGYIRNLMREYAGLLPLQAEGLAGGGIVIGGEPHWIVDNAGNPVAALSEDGKSEAVKGTNKGVEVVPLDPVRNQMYNAAKKNVPGMAFGGLKNIGSSNRTAPSRRLGSSSGNTAKNLSGSRVSLPGGAKASTKRPVQDSRVNNGLWNNGRAIEHGRTRDRDAASIWDAASRVREMIANRGPVSMNVMQRNGQRLPMIGFGRAGMGTQLDPTMRIPAMQPSPEMSILPVPQVRRIPGNDMSTGPIAPIIPVTGAAFGMSPTFIASGGDRVIGDNVRAPRFGFAANAPSDIAGRNVSAGVKNTPGVYVKSAWKFDPRTFRTMNSADRALLESYVRATGGDPASFWEQAGFAEPQSATSRRQFL